MPSAMVKCRDLRVKRARVCCLQQCRPSRIFGESASAMRRPASLPASSQPPPNGHRHQQCFGEIEKKLPYQPRGRRRAIAEDARYITLSAPVRARQQQVCQVSANNQQHGRRWLPIQDGNRPSGSLSPAGHPEVRLPKPATRVAPILGSSPASDQPDPYDLHNACNSARRSARWLRRGRRDARTT